MNMLIFTNELTGIEASKLEEIFVEVSSMPQIRYIVKSLISVIHFSVSQALSSYSIFLKALFHHDLLGSCWLF